MCCRRRDAPPGKQLRFQFRKSFHVSPFMAMDFDYDWRFSHPGSRLAVHMENQRAGGTMFDATLTLERRKSAAAASRRHWFAIPLPRCAHWAAFTGRRCDCCSSACRSTRIPPAEGNLIGDAVTHRALTAPYRARVRCRASSWRTTGAG